MINPIDLVYEEYNSRWDRAPNTYYVTDLITPPRIVLMRIRHKDEIPDRPYEETSKALMGTALHELFAKKLRYSKHGKDFLIEYPVWDKFLGKKIKGRLDGFYKPEGVLFDYKTTGTYKGTMPPTEFEPQLNIYAYLLRLAGWQTNALQVLYWHPDWNKYQISRQANYPKKRWHRKPVTLWSYDAQHEYTMLKIANLNDAEDQDDNNLPRCTDEERWITPKQYAVVSPKADRAHRVMEDLDRLHEWIDWKNQSKSPLPKGYSIEERPQTYRRCTDFCDVNQLCSQYQEWQEQNET